MNDDRTHDGFGPDETQALQALRRLPRSAADQDARARARAAFLDGTEVLRMPEGGSAFGRVWAGFFAAAAAAVLALMFVGMQPVAEWRVLDTAGGAPFESGMTIDHGFVTTGEGQEVELQLGELLRFRMMPGTEVELPPPPRRWFASFQRLTVNAGEIFGTTGGHKSDLPFAFTTGELEALLTGTTFAVFRTDDASCVCLWEGGILVDPLVGDAPDVTLEPGQRVWVYRDGRAPEVLPLTDMERMKLGMMEDAGLAPVD